jgi:hypothetical protein
LIDRRANGLLDPVAKMLRLPFGTPEFIGRIVTGGLATAGDILSDSERKCVLVSSGLAG